MRMVRIGIDDRVLRLLEHGVNRHERSEPRAKWHIGYGSLDRVASERHSGILERVRANLSMMR